VVRFRLMGIAAVIIAFSVTGFWFLIRFLPGHRSIPIAQQILAERGVKANAEWDPVVRRIGQFEMVLVPSGCFQMGSTDDQLLEAIKSCNRYFGIFGCNEDFSIERPTREVCLSKPFWFGLTPVTNRQYRLPRGTEDMVAGFRSPSSPRGIVTWAESEKFCEDRGARLPTEAEWEFAARGPDGLIYPFGNEFVIEKATLQKISPPSVGENPEGASWVGAQDMSGGISEWVTDWYGAYPDEPETDPTGPSEGEFRIARGGNWFAHASYFVRTTFREILDPNHATTTIGFRCAMDYEP
jgi:formylglycine-generating enzyme required for sulfatase activity